MFIVLFRRKSYLDHLISKNENGQVGCLIRNQNNLVGANIHALDNRLVCSEILALLAIKFVCHSNRNYIIPLQKRVIKET
jgi:pyrimidine deaminase RibD-like protein